MKYAKSKQLIEFIKKAKHILLSLHPSPDGDSVGSNLALYFVLKNMGKKVDLISGDSTLPLNYQTIPGANKILPQNIFETNLENYDLFIALDAASVKQISRLDNYYFPQKLNLVVIDHHPSNQGFGHLSIVDKKSPATGQILFEIFKDLKIKIDKNTAIGLLISIYDDTLFKYPLTTFRTFEIAAELTKIFPKFSQYIFDIENRNSPDRIKLLGISLTQIENPLPELAISGISYDQLLNLKLPRSATENTDVASLLKSVISWQVGASCIEYQENKTKISLRTRDPKKYNLSKLATALGGGGHRAAAGANIDANLSESINLLTRTFKKVYN